MAGSCEPSDQAVVVQHNSARRVTASPMRSSGLGERGLERPEERRHYQTRRDGRIGDLVIGAKQ